MNTRGQFHLYLSAKYRDIASREIGVNGQRTDRRTTRKHNALRLQLLAKA